MADMENFYDDLIIINLYINELQKVGKKYTNRGL